MKIKKGDTVKMLHGKDRNKSGKVIRVSPSEGKLVVEGCNMRTKHQRPRRKNEKGQRIQFAAAVPIGSVMLMCPACGKATRVGAVQSADGKKSRACKKCKAII